MPTEQPEFFKPGHTYLRPTPHGTQRRFRAIAVGAPSEGFAHPQEGDQVAFGWSQRITPDGSIEPIGSDYQDDFSKWTLDPDAEVVPQLAYRADFAGMTLGSYATREVAQEHCEADLRNNVNVRGRSLGWVPEDDSEWAVSELSLFGPGVGDEDITSYTVTPFELLTAYDPEAEG